MPVGTKAAYEAVTPWRDFWNIEEMDFSGIGDAVADDGKYTISVENGTIMIDGLDGSNVVEIYDIQGRVVYSGTESSISALPSGLYIVKIGTTSLKIAI